MALNRVWILHTPQISYGVGEGVLGDLISSLRGAEVYNIEAMFSYCPLMWGMLEIRLLKDCDCCHGQNCMDI